MSKYGGQAAAAGVEGYKSGYAFQDKARATHQQARLREEQIKEAKTKNNLMDVAYQDAMGYGAEPTQEQKLTKEVQDLKARVNKTNGGIMNNDISTLAMQNEPKAREQYIKSLQTKFKTNPEVYKSLGIQNPQTMGILNPADSRDREWMEKTLMAKGQNVKREDYGDNWDDMITETMAAYPAIKADGAIVDLNGLSVATGAASMATPQYNKIMEKNRKELQARWDRDMKNTENAMTADLGGKGAGGDGYVDRPDKPLEDPTKAVFEARNKAFSEGTADIEKTSQVNEESIKAIGDFKKETILKRYKSVGNKAQQFYTDYNKWAVDNGYPEAAIASGGRTQEEQNELYAQGRTKPGNIVTWTKNSKHIGGNAMDMVSGSMSDTKNNTKVAEGMREFAKQNPNYGANFLSMSKDPNHVQFDDVKPSTEKAGTVSQVKQEVSSIVSQSNGQPLDDMRMRKIYALLGKNYPKNPNEATAKMKNFDFLSERVGEEQAMEAVFGASGSSGRMEKAIKFLRTLEPGSKEYEAQENYIKKLGRSGTASEQDFKDWREELKDPNITPERQAELNEKMRDSMDTSSTQTKKDNIGYLKQARSGVEALQPKIDNFYKTGEKLTGEDTKSLQLAQDQMYEFAPAKTKERDTKTVDSMKANQVAGKEIATTLGRMAPGGDLEDMEKGIVDNAAQWVETKIPSGMVNEGRKDIIEANIRAGSVLGYLQATLIRAMSGTAASEAEVQRLQDVMQGSSWNQPEDIKIALDEFRNGLVRQQDTLRGQLAVSPYDAYNLSDMGSLASDKRTKDKGKIVGRNEATGEVMYEDGTVGKAE